MITITDKSMCSGCGACRDSCALGAISLQPDEEGFLYPVVDEDKCVKCGKCVKICPVLHPEDTKAKAGMPVAYAAQTRNEAVRLKSSSGGIFTELATCILRQGGVVFGAAFDEQMQLRHIGIESEEDLDKLRGSKYVQSRIGSAYKECKTYLRAGRLVLFTGTPCQIGGLHRFLNREYDNLCTQDIICHGVPAPVVWKKYVAWREKIAASHAISTSFRNKEYGWKMFSLSFRFANNRTYIKNLQQDLYMRSFLRNMSLRPSCYNCAFKTRNRVSDITLADFWRVEKVRPDMDDDKGTSLVILHSERGRRLFESVRENLQWEEVNFEDSIQYNSAMTQSVPLNAHRNTFVSMVVEHDFPSAARQYLRVSWKDWAKITIRSILAKIRKRK